VDFAVSTRRVPIKYRTFAHAVDRVRMDADLSKVTWEKRKKGGLAPSTRSGCSMTHWSAKGMGVLFGGVHDEEEKENMKSVFYNDLSVQSGPAIGFDSVSYR